MFYPYFNYKMKTERSIIKIDRDQISTEQNNEYDTGETLFCEERLY